MALPAFSPREKLSWGIVEPRRQTEIIGVCLTQYLALPTVCAPHRLASPKVQSGPLGILLVSKWALQARMPTSIGATSADVSEEASFVWAPSRSVA